jgi:signal transduction histidine kinase
MKRCLLILLLFCMAWRHAPAQTACVISDPAVLYNLADQCYFVEDASGRMSVDEIRSEPYAARFQKFTKPFINFGVTESAYWLKLVIRNQTPEDVFLELGNTALTHIHLFEFSHTGSITQHRSGCFVPFYKREVSDVNFVFKLAAKNNEEETLFLRVQHDRGTQFPLTAGTLISFDKENNNRNLLEGIYYGFMLLMVLYNLFIYFSLKDRAYIYYVLYIFFMGLLNASINGYAFKYFWPSAPALNQYEDVISALVGMSGILFATNFLNTKKNTPFLHRVFVGLFVLYTLCIGVVLSRRFLAGSVFVEITSLVLVLSFFAAAYSTLRKGYKPAKFFLIAWTLLLLSVIIFILKDFDILPYNSFTVNSLQIGSAFEALLLSMALANRINIYKQEKEQAQLEALRSLEENRKLITEQNILLEGKVEERTRALKQANKELVSTLESLQATQAQLVQREKMASLGELTAGIAHEIQNPLNFVNNFSEVSTELLHELQEGPLKSLPSSEKPAADEILSDLSENLRKIAHHGKRADSIVKGMLQHSRASTGQKEATDINVLLDEFLHLSYQGLRAKDKSFNATLETQYEPALGKINLVPQDIGRVFLNLFNNAFYSVKEKARLLDVAYTPTVSVRTQLVGNDVQIEVCDNGLGIPRKILDKIYQPFFTTKPTGVGTGLGLSLSYEIITKGHGGTIQVETKEGAYAKFTISLPK